MRRYLLEPEFIQGNSVLIQGEDFHHICGVCRQIVGSKFEVLTTDGFALLVEIKTLQKKSALAEVLEKRTVTKLKRPYIHLHISIPKFQTMDSLLEKLVELGVYSIQPFFSDFSFVRNSNSLSENKQIRWQKIIKSAMQQSARTEPLILHKAIYFHELLENINQNPMNKHLFAYEGQAPLTIFQYLNSPQENHPKPPEDMHLYVGSEGGFSHREVSQLLDLGLKPVTLGDQVLRVETACLSLVSILKYHYQC